MKHLSPLRWVWLLLVIFWAALLIWFALTSPAPAGGQGVYPPPVMWTATPRPLILPTSRPYRTPAPACCHVYAPTIERGK